MHKILLSAFIVGLCHGFCPRLLFKSPSSTRTMLEGSTLVMPDTTGIEEEACLEAAANMKRLSVPVSTDISPDGEVGISYVHWPSRGKKISASPIFLVHGFDSSCLEYRRLGPLLAQKGVDVYAVDLLGWGFSQLDRVQTFGAAAKVEALSSFIEKVTGSGRPFSIAGASLGGAAAIELAATNDLCQGLVLLDAQGFVDGIGPMASLPTPLAKLGVGVLKSVPLRSSANQMSYYNKEKYATVDALNIGRVHCLQEGWDDALVSFMQSGGFSPSKKVPQIRAPTLILWGRQDKVLSADEFVPKFQQALPDAQFQWVEECGHVPHLEQPDQTAALIAEFLEGSAADAKKPSSNFLRTEWIAPIAGLSALAAFAADLLPVH